MLQEQYFDSLDGNDDQLDDLIYDRDESYGSCTFCKGSVVFDPQFDSDICVECGRIQ